MPEDRIKPRPGVAEKPLAERALELADELAELRGWTRERSSCCGGGVLASSTRSRAWTYTSTG